MRKPKPLAMTVSRAGQSSYREVPLCGTKRDSLKMLVTVPALNENDRNKTIPVTTIATVVVYYNEHDNIQVAIKLPNNEVKNFFISTLDGVVKDGN